MKNVLIKAGLALALAATISGPAAAATVTFDNGVLQTFVGGLSGIYTEAGMQFDIYGAAPQLVDYGNGTKSLRIELNNDIVIHRVGGGTFSFDSFLFSGGGDTVMGGYHGNFFSGGLNNGAGADVAFSLGGLGGVKTPVVSNSLWANVDVINWCGYCISGFAPSNYIDNFTFSVPAENGVPEPAAWALMILGFGGVGTVLRRRFGRATA